MYGKALEGTPENAKGIDVWVKRIDSLVITQPPPSKKVG
jgi:hypothetical protein